MQKYFRVAIIACGLCTDALAQTPADEAEVYRLVLGAMTFESPGSPFTRHALIASTFDPGTPWRSLDEDVIKSVPYLHPRTRLTYAKSETVEDFLEVIAREKPLPKALAKLQGFLLVDRKRAQSMTARGDWDKFAGDNRLAPGSVGLSRIGFDKSGSQALVYVSFSCGSLCGNATFVMLERGATGWTIAKIEGYADY